MKYMEDNHKAAIYLLIIIVYFLFRAAWIQQIAVILQHEIQNSKTKIYIVSFQMALELGYLKGGYVNFCFAVLDIMLQGAFMNQWTVPLEWWRNVPILYSLSLFLYTSLQVHPFRHPLSRVTFSPMIRLCFLIICTRFLPNHLAHHSTRNR